MAEAEEEVKLENNIGPLDAEKKTVLLEVDKEDTVRPRRRSDGSESSQSDLGHRLFNHVSIAHRKLRDVHLAAERAALKVLESGSIKLAGRIRIKHIGVIDAAA